MSLVQVQTPRQRAPRKAAATQTHQAYPFSAPIKGVDVSQPLPGGNPFTAIRMDNLIPRVLGCQLRKGYTRWVSNMGGEIRSLMAYHPPTGDAQLFAATSTGAVFDVTIAEPASITPVPVLNVAGTVPGEWTSINFTSTEGVHVMLAVCLGVGLYKYDAVGGWVKILQGTAAGEIEGVDPALFGYLTVFKNRLWFIEAGTTRCWYLPPGQFAGKATEFDFGAMLPNGGAVVGLVNWTFDGSAGVGLDNKFIVIADQGDVLVYQGTDPEAVDGFGVAGRWYIGRVPVGNRFFNLYGSDVAILSERGMVFMSELMRGQGFFENPQIAQNINSELAIQVASTLGSRYWEISFVPHEQLIIINLPEYNAQNIQWAYEVNNKAFCNLRGLPMNTVATMDGRTFIGDLVGNVWWAFQGQSDGEVDGTPGTDLLGTVVTAFQPLGEGFRIKRFLMVRPSFISSSAPGVKAQLNKEWSLLLPDGAPAYLNAGENFWDQGSWDNAVWSGATGNYEAWMGANGAGRYGSLSMQVRGAADTIFIGWQALVEQGGVL